ncbi:aspartic proteinase CDR1-like isoform X2 [Prosopis cineraria]|uniref:aspartic proteinase CDR1-like isoform X2 n=1 Tax=Prosopis cineraria TaxID=364024 RepID=UPI002410B5C9|nr:aspartic proteinase CDR1-like isoform X2 [Prosopis cineraria]
MILIFPNSNQNQANMLALPLFFFLFLSSIPILTSGLTLDFDLIHRDSPLSPFYNSSSTLSELTRQVRLRSMVHHHKRLHHHLHTDILPPIFYGGQGEYLMRIYIGSPPVESWAIVDTGSDLIWVQCLPCNTCYPQNSPIFNPFKSSTYKIVSCHSKPCTFFNGQSDCGFSTQCVYKYGYGDGSITTGDFARDVFSFRGKSDSFQRTLLIGCGHNNTGAFSGKGSGLVGLGMGPLSLVSQLGPEIGHKFSYCLVPYFSKSIGKLKLGKEAKISHHGAVSTTPFVTDSDSKTNYFLTLEGITIGNKTLKIGPKTEGNTLIDSGQTWFLIESSFYTKMEPLIKKAIRVKEVNFQVEHDIEARKISFAHVDCGKH